MGSSLAKAYQDPDHTLVVYTPAIKILEELNYFKSAGFQIV
jgi:hypothetical protein